MKVGTKSILFGAHCFLIHPIFVFIAWCQLYGFPYDPRIWIAFFVHDLGYWGKPNMDGPEGEKHVELGAKIMSIFGHRWRDLSLYSKVTGLRNFDRKYLLLRYENFPVINRNSKLGTLPAQCL
jgi:hypothetical protein